MKKMIALILLSSVMMLSGCAVFQGSYNSVPNTELSESLLTRMQNNISTRTLEGFTRESTIGDVVDTVGATNISQVHLMYPCELLGYPAVAEYVFDNTGGGYLCLDFMSFCIYPKSSAADYESELEEFVNNMDAELGSHETDFDDEFGDEYYWHINNCTIDMTAYEEDYLESGMLADFSVHYDFAVFGFIPKAPDLFPYQFGTEFSTIYQSESPGILPEDSSSCQLSYEDKGIEIRLQFKSDETGIRLSEGQYDILLNSMNSENSLDYFESLADGLEAAVGKADVRWYGIPEVFEDDFGALSGYTYEEPDGAQRMSAQDILDSGKNYYLLNIRWKDISFDADHVADSSIHMDFSEQYIGGTARD